MAYFIEIKETAESKSLVEHLRSLKYVKVSKAERKTYDVNALVEEVKKSEKSKRISWKEAKKEMASWK